jgi:ankyrin repeat protein
MCILSAIPAPLRRLVPQCCTLFDSKENPLTDHADSAPPSRSQIDPELLALAQEVFDLARRGDASMLAAVLEKGVPPNLRNDKGDSLVMLASYHGHADAVRTLLERGADPNLRNDNGQTPIAGAAFKGFDKVIETLLAHGADVEGASPDGRTALMVAAMFNRTAIVELLIAHGANPQAHDANGVTASDAAARMGAGDAQARLKELGS